MRKAITNLKNGKAARINGIQAKIINVGDETVITTVTELCNEVWDTEIVPAD